MYQDIAIIGVSMRLPQANNMESLHENLSNKKDCVRKVPKERKELLKLEDDKEYLEVGYIDDIEYFDHGFFNIPSMEADVMCIEQRFSLEMAAEAIYDAGYSLESFRGKNCAVYVSTTDNEYKLLAGQDSGAAYTGNLKSLTAGKVCYHLDLHGPNVTVDSACSSSLVALHEGCMKLVSEESDYALVGGLSVNIYIPEFEDKDFNNLGVISKGGRSYSFDAKAQGTGMGEGGGFVLLKRYQEALRDKDHIYGVIKGSAINSDGFRGSSLTAPSAQGQKEAIIKAWERAGISGKDVTEIEAHGTGTLIGDPIEVEGLQSSFEESDMESRKVYLSALKSSIGHLGAAAGIASVLKCVTQFQEDVTYPIVHFEKPNPYIHFEETNLIPTKEIKHWNRNDRRIVGINSFGFSGTNAHVVIENYRGQENEKKESLLPLILKLSAKSEESFENNAKAIADYLEKSKENIDDILFTLNTGRDDYVYRACVVGNSKEELCQRVRSIKPKTAGEAKKTAVIISMPKDVTMEQCRRDVEQYRALEQANIKVDYLLADEYGKYIAKIAKEEKIPENEEIENTLRKLRETYNPKPTEDIIRKLKEQHSLVAVYFHDTGEKIASDEKCRVILAIDSREQMIKELYEEGVKVSFAGLYEGENVHRVSAPAYCFAKRKHWIYPTHKFSVLGITDTLEEKKEEKKDKIEDTEKFKEELKKLWEDILEEEVEEDSDFFDLGGNSLTGMMLVEEIAKRYDIHVEFEDVYDYGTLKEFGEFLLEKNQEMQQEQKTEVKAEETAKVQEHTGKFLLNSAQKMIYQTCKEYPENSAWNLCMSIGIKGALDIERISQAVQKMIDRNECYRTIFYEEEGEIYQEVLSEYPYDVKVMEGVGENREERYQWCKRAIDEKSNITIPFINQVPMCIEIYKYDTQDYILYIGVSHLISDGSSLSIIINDLNRYYSGEQNSEENILQLYDYCLYQSDLTHTEQGRKQRQYWENYLKDLPATLDYPYQHYELAEGEYIGQSRAFAVEESLYKKIGKVCKELRISLFTYTMLAYHILLAKNTKKKDVYCTVATANRREGKNQEISGCLADCIIFRSVFKEKQTIKEALENLSKGVKEGLDNQEYPFYDLMWELRKEEPRFMEQWGEFFMAFQNYKSSDLCFEDLQLCEEIIDKRGCKTNFSLCISENGKCMYGGVEYNNQLFDEKAVDSFMKEYLALLDKLSESLDETIDNFIG